MERLNSIKLIVTDLDGTLLDEQKQIDQHIISLLPTLKEKEILFTFATGRNMQIVQEYVSQLQIDIPYITNNGANMNNKEICIYESCMPYNALQDALEQLQHASIAFLAFSATTVYEIGSHPEQTNFLKRLEGKIDIIKIDNEKELLKHSILKIVVTHNDDSVMNYLMKQINNHYKELHFVRSEGNIYSLTHREASKGNTLKKLMDLLHVKKDEVLVFGDNYNDISMFQATTYSVAMANASKDIKTHATYVGKSNTEYGVSWFIKTFILT